LTYVPKDPKDPPQFKKLVSDVSVILKPSPTKAAKTKNDTINLSQTKTKRGTTALSTNRSSSFSILTMLLIILWGLALSYLLWYHRRGFDYIVAISITNWTIIGLICGTQKKTIIFTIAGFIIGTATSPFYAPTIHTYEFMNSIFFGGGIGSLIGSIIGGSIISKIQ